MRKVHIAMIVLMFSLIVVPSLVSALPPIPRTFWSHDGNSLLDGQPVPAGALIEAYDPNGVLCGNYIVIEAGRFVFNCIGDDPYTLDDEGALSGDTITFYINGNSASVIDGSAVWQSGFQEVNIQATSSGASFSTEGDDSNAAFGETDVGSNVSTSLEMNVITNQEILTWDIGLAPGWNLISFPTIIPLDNSIPAVFAPLAGSLLYIYHYDASIPEALERWLVWDNTIPEQYWAIDNTLQSVEPNKAYWVFLESDEPLTLTVEGPEFPCNEVYLYEGWNFVSFQLVDESLVDFREQLDFVYMYSYDSFISNPIERWLIWDNTLHPELWVLNTLERVEPTKGYWLWVDFDQPWAEVECVQNIDVNPLVYEFGDVLIEPIPHRETTIVTIGNVGISYLIIDSLSFGSGSSEEFSITAAPSTPVAIYPGSSIDVEIQFYPTAVGFFSAVLLISFDDPGQTVVSVELNGYGVTEAPPPLPVYEILNFFWLEYEAGQLVEIGPGRSGPGRLRALWNMIEAAGDLINNGYITQACQQLMDACNRCDGVARPPDFISGNSTTQLNSMIQELIASLGCQ